MRRTPFFAVVSFVLVTQAALAAPKAAAPKKGASKQVVTDALAQLKTHEPDKIVAALEAVRPLREEAASLVPIVHELLDDGLPPAAAQSAIAFMADVEANEAVSTLATYSSHRDEGVRRAATKALGHFKTPAATTALRRVLGDQDAGVRGAAASALGAQRTRAALPDLIIALDQRVLEAASAIGQICDKEECRPLLARLGKLPFDVVTGGLAVALYRPNAEVPEKFKIEIVEHIRELGTMEAHKFLEDVSKSKGLSKELKASVDEAVRRTGGAP